MRMPAQSKQQAYAETRAIDRKAHAIMSQMGCSFSEAWTLALIEHDQSGADAARKPQADRDSGSTYPSLLDGQEI